MSSITGAILVGAEERQGSGNGFEAVDPSSGKALSPRFAEADAHDVADACALAAAAFPAFRDLPPEDRAAFLERIADAIAATGEELIDRAMSETGLPRARLEGERGRTVGQLRLFAIVVREGGWMDVTIDPAMPDRQPLPRPDLRRVNMGVGPVAVFGASNFPLAFSVAGGDTASALAAGCPVVVKGHPAHPGTGEIVARIIRQAVADSGLPAGVFSYLPGTTNALGGALVADPRIKSVGFTGSRGGGLALVKIANARPEPIPVFAEMSSINPVILFPAAAQARGAALGTAFVASLTQGAGQFCTNPGLVIALANSDLAAFEGAAVEALAKAPNQHMLTPGIHNAFQTGVTALEGHAAVETLAKGPVGDGINQASGAIFTADADAFAADAALSHEVFGSSSIIVRAPDIDAVASLVSGLEGQLTATLLFDEEDEPLVAPLIPLLAEKAGRILANGWPTGVEVSHAMVHGGPFPATSDTRTTSVGTLAIQRFLRPVCYQNLPDRLLPTALRNDNPCKVARRVDGTMQLA
ncbi:NADP-dependent aldehyde dehydrogenase [Sphingomonas gellani]|uniref:2,5-dioxovalerate dehydrogenase n=1 Tax=Sphingomonas gellani TaxID=1166340 RepID=A0A1H8CXW5_9SPHN|nr:aldehyde dehydrogenase (NADP(+)) [Sphingomonas gellani]SEM99845.1 NADP-dependent aldehyde dehydrogenase [Sphingomonas gellani]